MDKRYKNIGGGTIKCKKSFINYYLCAIAYKCLGDYSKAKVLGTLALNYADDGGYALLQEHILNI